MSTSDYSKPFRSLTSLLPNSIKNPVNTALLSDLFDKSLTHEESVRLYGLIGRYFPNAKETRPWVTQSNIERTFNQFVPMIATKVGTEEYFMSFADLLNKAQISGIDLSTVSSWMSSKAFNFVPPIDIDKFANYSNYFWVQSALPYEDISWNPLKKPEYYTIAKPSITSKQKLPVLLATTDPLEALNGTGKLNQVWTITFTGPTSFTIVGSVDTIPEAITFSGSTYVYDGSKPLAFTIEVGTNPFVSGDIFTIQVEHLSTLPAQISFTGTGTGVLSGTRGTLPFTSIDGTTLTEGMRVLVKNQVVSSENGIYLVSAGNWVRSYDTIGSYSDNGIEVYVKSGTDNHGKMFKSLDGETYTEDSNLEPLSDWQTSNYWVHGKDLHLFGLNASGDVQRATRPIIEYDEGLELVSGQIKSRFNQPPLFNLYWPLDGTKAPWTSSIFYYVEDPNEDFDAVLQRRVKADKTGNFYFAQGLKTPDNDGRMLAFKQDGVIRTIWRSTEQNVEPYVNNAIIDRSGTGNLTSFEVNPMLDSQTWTIVPQSDGVTFTVTGSRAGVQTPDAVAGTPYTSSSGDISFFIHPKANGTYSQSDVFIIISGIEASINTNNETWTLTYKNPTTYEVRGSKAGQLLDATIGSTYISDFIAFNFDAPVPSSVTFTSAQSDNMMFRVASSFEEPRYAISDEDGMPKTGTIYNDVNHPGCWLTPPQLMMNPERENRSEVLFGDLSNHFINIIANQPEFFGSAFGSNNHRLLQNANPGFGGKIKTLNGAHNLFFSLLNQHDLTPISLLDFAELQYGNALNSIPEYILTSLPEALGMSADGSIDNLFSMYEADYALKGASVGAFNQTTSPITYWPITLPMMGMMNAVQPLQVYDFELDAYVTIHHDGHQSPIFTADSTLSHNIALAEVLRYDGTITRGTVSVSTPIQPYRGQLWYNGTELKYLSVDYEGEVAPDVSGVLNPSGKTWYNRVTNELRLYNATTLVWDLASISMLNWVVINIQDIVNALVLKAEQKLYDVSTLGSSTNTLRWDISNPVYQDPYNLQYELAKFAIQNSYDPLGSVYDISDPFTWNYHLATVGTLPSIARWHKLYEAYFATFAGIAPGLTRPDATPWKFFGHDTYAEAILAQPSSPPGKWAYEADYPLALLEQGTFKQSVTVVSTSNIDLLTLVPPLVISSIVLSNGDTVLLTAQTNDVENGLYIWNGLTLSRVAGYDTSSNISLYDYFVVEKGPYTDSIWIVTSVPTTIDIDTFAIHECRVWKSSLWTDVQALYPGIKLCVNTNTDVLLPPYVSLSSFMSSQALLTTEPLGVRDSYMFGDEGPVELIWRHSIAFAYSQARSSYKINPVKFLETNWGFQTFTSNELELDRMTGDLMTHYKFSLHGEPVHTSNTLLGIPEIIFSNVLVGGTRNFTLEVVYQQLDGQLILATKDEAIIILHQGTTFTNGADISFDFVVNENGRPLIIGDKFEIDLLTNGTGTSTFIPATIVTYKGLNQLYTQFLAYNAMDSSVSKNVQLFRNWKTQLAYRSGTLIEQGNLRLSNDTYRNIPDTSYRLFMNKSTLAKNLWLHALRVQVIEIGIDKELTGQDVEGNILYKPKNAGTQWKFRIENYFSRHPQIDTYTLNTSGTFETFNAFSKAHSVDEWRNYLEVTSIVSINLPINITGIQNVVNFLHAYAMYVENQGFAFGQGDTPAQDPITGRLENWQLEIERFIDGLYKGVSPGKGFGVNPFMEKFWLFTPTGLPASFVQRRFDDILTSQFIYDVTGDIIQPHGSTVIRFDDHTEIKGDVPMFGSHMTIDEYEHLILFENYITSSPFPEGLFYDPFLNLSIEKLLIDAKARRNHTFRPTFGGYFLNDQHDFKKNIAGSIDDVSNYYNADKIYDNDDTTKHALSLLGFSKKGYFDLLRTNERSEFNFWRAMVNAKGTQYSIDAFLNSVKFEHAKLDEFWAYKVAEYGDARTPTYPELKLQANDCTLKHTRLFFEQPDSLSVQAPSTYISILPTDENRWYTLSDLNTSLKFEPEVRTHTLIITEIDTLVELPKADAYTIVSKPTTTANVTFHTQSVISCDTLGEYKFQMFVPAKPKFSPIKLFDYVDRALIEDITTWHPAFDNHTAIAMEVINVVSKKDPAFYNYSTLTVKNPNYDPQKSWGDREVGRTWWDQTLLDYVPYYDKVIFPTFEERLGRWGSMAEYSSINLYEWVKSSIPPSEYDAQSAIDQLSADVALEDKKTGKAARKQLYKRTRTWEARPIAWSYVPTPPEAQDVQLFKAGTTRLTLNSPGVGEGYVHLEKGRFAQYGLVPGMHFSGFLGGKPYGEAVLTGPIRFTLSDGYHSGDMHVSAGDGTFFDLIQFVWSDNKNYIGAAIGNIDFEWSQIGATYYMRAVERASGVSVTQPLYDYSGQEGGSYELDFVQLGIKMIAISAVTTMTSAEIVVALQSVLSPSVGLFNLEIKEYSPIQVLIPFPNNILDNVLPISLPVSYDNSLMVSGINVFSNVTFVKGAAASIGVYSISGELNTLDDTYYLYLMKDSIRISSLAIDTLTSAALAIQPLTETFTFNFAGSHLSVEVEVHPSYLSSGVEASDVIDELSAIGASVVVGYDVSSNTVGIENGTSTILDEYGWIGYEVPSQEILDADLKYPHNSWTPVYGDYSSVPSVRSVIDEIVAYEKEPLKLNDGTIIEKFNPLWGDWVLLEQEVVRKFGTNTTLDLQFNGSKIADNTLRLYLNGISQPKSFYSINATLVSTTKVIPNGHEVVGIVSAYEPTSEELAFDPDVSDDPSIQTQYKSDYQYVIRPTRDSSGNITGDTYYFWVKDKTVPVGNKQLTCQQSAQLLREGPSTYLTFQELFDNAYHGITIAGLNMMVNKDNTYKLRFTRDFSLRDNPQDLDLKNTHTEWTLLRPQQDMKIPLTLWNKLVDSAAGQNIAGQSLPALNKVLYDERHGTRTRYGFRDDQVLAERSLVTASLSNSILNPKTSVYLNGINTTATINGLDLSQSSTWFVTPASTRQVLDYIWRHALPQHINELFFEVLNDALANNYEFTDIFKTSRLSVHSIITVTPETIVNNADVYF